MTDRNEFYTMVFRVCDRQKFATFASELFETMNDMSGETVLHGVRLTGAAVGSVMSELGDWQKYAEYLRDYADNRVGTYTTPWEFEDWERNGKPDNFDEDAHTDESYEVD